MVEDADLLWLLGLMSRIVKRAVMEARKQGLKVGLMAGDSMAVSGKVFQEAAKHAVSS